MKLESTAAGELELEPADLDAGPLVPRDATGPPPSPAAGPAPALPLDGLL